MVFSLVGQIASTGLVEVPLGLTFSELLEEIGGGSIPYEPLSFIGSLVDAEDAIAAGASFS